MLYIKWIIATIFSGDYFYYVQNAFFFSFDGHSTGVIQGEI